MIKLVFTYNRETLRFVVLNKEIFYSDRLFKSWIRVMPKDEAVTKQILMSRNRIPKAVTQLFNFSKAEIEEYNKAEDERQLADIVIRDAKTKGLKMEIEKE
jgi:hypothetical protein